MKRGGVRASGIITIIMYLLLLVVGVFSVANVFKVEAIANLIVKNQVIYLIYQLVNFIFVYFPIILLLQIPSTDPELMPSVLTVLTVIFAVFCLFMIIWGIKEITLCKKSDERFARCKRTCSFMNFTKFMVFAYLVAVIVCNFVVEGFGASTENFAEALGVPYIFVIVTGVLAFLAFLCFILAVSNMFKVARAVKRGDHLPQGSLSSENTESSEQAFYNYNSSQQNSQMQANMPPMGYQPQYNSVNQVSQNEQINAQPQSNFQPTNTAQQNSQSAQEIKIIPGQDGVPINITSKGIQDLERLERLKRNGAISDINYNVMKVKICNSNLSN